MDADIAGFAAAQERLRGQFGESAVFLQAPVYSYPPGTLMDPDTGAPYDPVVVATASAQASAVVRCDVAYEAFRAGRDRDNEPTALGFLDRAHLMLISGSASRAQCEGAVNVILRGQSYKVTNGKPDGIGGVQRWLTYARRGQ